LNGKEVAQFFNSGWLTILLTFTLGVLESTFLSTSAA